MRGQAEWGGEKRGWLKGAWELETKKMRATKEILQRIRGHHVKQKIKVVDVVHDGNRTVTVRSPTIPEASLSPTPPTHTCRALGGGVWREAAKGWVERELACCESAYLMGAPAVTSWGEGQPAGPC